MLGDYSGGVTPVPIPNTEVKPSNADDTAPVRGGKVGRRQVFFCLFITLDVSIDFFIFFPEIWLEERPD